MVSLFHIYFVTLQCKSKSDMGLILSIDTATTVCSVALARDGELISERESVIQNSHAEVLSTLIGEVLEDASAALKEVDAVAVSAGPGSYTGLRIGVSTAKGLCYALDKPLISIPSLQIIAAATVGELFEVKRALLCPMIDARRMEVYTALYDRDLTIMNEVEAVVLNSEMFDNIEGDIEIFVSGNGAEKSVPLFADKTRVKVVKGIELHARFMVQMAERKFENGEFENLAYYEPFYLKEFVAGKPRVKGLH